MGVKNSVLNNSKPAKRYAKALIGLLKDEKNIDENILGEELKFVFSVIEENAELAGFLENPIVSKRDKADVINELFSKRVSGAVIRFLMILNEENRLNLLCSILNSYKDEIDRKNNVLNVKIFSAVNLDDTQKKAIKEKLEAKTGKNVVFEFEVDNDRVLGGLIIKIKDTVIDLSLKRKLENLKDIIER